MCEPLTYVKLGDVVVLLCASGETRIVALALLGLCGA